jgi:hypothetical protein
MSGAKRSPWLWSGVAALLLPACYLLAQCVNDCKEVSYTSMLTAPAGGTVIPTVKFRRTPFSMAISS